MRRAIITADPAAADAVMIIVRSERHSGWVVVVGLGGRVTGTPVSEKVE